MIVVVVKKSQVIMNWLKCEGLHFVQTLIGEEQNLCKNSIGLVSVLNMKFEPQHNKTILLLQYCKLSSDENKSAEEWMDYLRVKANESIYKEHDRHLKKQFINRINDEMITAERIKELTTIQKTSGIMSEQVNCCSFVNFVSFKFTLHSFFSLSVILYLLLS